MDQLFYRLVAIKEKLKGLTLRQTIKFGMMLLFVAALPFTLFAVQQRQEIRQRASESSPTSVPPATAAIPELNCTNDITYPASYDTTYPQLKAIMSCLHKTYCVVQGTNHAHLGADNLGYTIQLTRSQYVAFLTRYHVNVLQDDWKTAFDTIQDYYNNSVKKFYDVSAHTKSPNYHALWKEIYTAQKMGFVQGYEDNTFKPEGLWRYGFHGITRTDTYKGAYNFASLANPMTRGEFLTQLYDYGMNEKRQLTSCGSGTIPTQVNFPPTPTLTATPIPTATPKPTATPIPIEPRFSDVPSSALGYAEIEKLANRRTAAPDSSGISGCSAAQFCPDTAINRADFSKFMIVGMKQSVSSASSIFTDVTATGAYGSYLKYIMRMKELGITFGCAIYAFCPANTIDRVTMMAFITRARSDFAAYVPPATPSFKDVPKTHTSYKAVEFAKAKGITSGCTTTTFCPTKNATRREAAIFLMRAWPN